MAADEQRANWQTVAQGWERHRAFMWAATRGVSERLVELLSPAPGDTVLELAAGSGDTGFLAAALVGPSGRLVSSDFVPEIVDSARRRAAELQLENVEFRLLDIASLDLPDESIDRVLCRWGYMLAPDPALALGETRRVLRPGGSVSFAVWGSSDENPWASSVSRVLLARGLATAPDPDAPGPFRLADRQRVKGLLADAGLELVVHEDVPLTWRYETFDDYWSGTRDVSRMLQAALARLDEREIAAVRAGVEERVDAYRQGDALVFPAVTQVVLARKAV